MRVSWYNLLMDIQEISAEKLLDIIEEKDRRIEEQDHRIEEQDHRIAELEQQVQWFMEQVRLARHKQYGTSICSTKWLPIAV
jgi:transposase